MAVYSTSIQFQKVKGVTLVEVLVAVLLFASGILGIAGIQLTSLNALTNSHSLNIAVMGASALSDRMRVNSVAVIDGNYDDLTGTETPDDCGTSCTPAQVAVMDAVEIKGILDRHLPNAILLIKPVSASENLYTIHVKWDEREKGESEQNEFKLTFLHQRP